MRFEQVYDLIPRYQANAADDMRSSESRHCVESTNIYIATEAKDCLELGTAFGATTCVMAAAVEENGGGTVTTIDHMAASRSACATGGADGTHSVRPRHRAQAGYNWFLLRVLREQTKGDVCEPCYDFCFLDGAHCGNRMRSPRFL